MTLVADQSSWSGDGPPAPVLAVKSILQRLFTRLLRSQCRWSYRVVWRDLELGEMRFHCLVSTASEPDGLAFNDWHPVDSDTWSVLEQVTARHAERANP